MDKADFEALHLNKEAIKKLLETHGADLKIVTGAGTIFDIASGAMTPGDLLGKVTTDNFDKVRNDTHDKETNTHDKGAQMGAGALVKPPNGLFIDGLNESELEKLHEKAGEILKGKGMFFVGKK